MTVIDKISFGFRMADEQFARSLYADWDRFCQHCVTDILEEFFAAYDDPETCLEIPTLKLDLGNIPQERFLEDFPLRLREELEKEFSYYKEAIRTEVPESASSEKSLSKRFENLRHYLQHGFCLPEWAGTDFDLYEELRRCMDMGYEEQLFLLLKQPLVLRRLFCQLDRSRLEKLFLSSADGPGTDSFLSLLFSPAFTLGRNERVRLLSLLLETVPQTVVQFIHISRETGSLNLMAELMEHPHIRSVMTAETENYAEIGVPEYWYRLYEWLLEYYPFNGVPMFGDKPHFRIHLNRSVLAFIHKRKSPIYLSKTDITLQFLLEVFGANHYLTVLDIIYHNQRLKQDGSPESGDSYAWELYYIFLQLSLIGKRQGYAGASNSQASDILARQDGAFGRWLENTEQTDDVKRRTLSQLIQDKPELLLRWLASRPERKHLSRLVALTGKKAWMRLAEHVSLQLAETLAVLSGTIERASASVMWLRNIDKTRMTEALGMAVWQGISTGTYPTLDSVPAQMQRVTELFYKEITGRELPSDDEVYAGILRATDLSGPEVTDSLEERFHMDNQADKRITSLKTVLADNGISEQAKKILLLQWFDTYRGREKELVSALVSERLWDTVFGLLDKSALRNIIIRLSGQIYSPESSGSGTDTIRFVRWLAEHIETAAELVSRPVKEVWRSLFQSLVSREVRTDSISADNAVVQLLSAVTGNESDSLQRVTGTLISRLLPSTDMTRILPDIENNLLLSLLVRVRSNLNFRNRTSERAASDALYDNPTKTDSDAQKTLEKSSSEGSIPDETQTIFKQYASPITGLNTNAFSFEVSATEQEETLFDEWVTWLLSPSVSDTEKSQKLRHYARWQPELLWKLLRYSTAETYGKKHTTSVPWSEWLGVEDWLEMMSGLSLSLGDTLGQTIRTVSGKYEIENKILAEGLVRFAASYPVDRIRYDNASDIVKKYLEHVIALSWENGMPEYIRERSAGTGVEDKSELKVPEEEKQTESPLPAKGASALEAVVKVVEEELHLTDAEQTLEEAVQPEYIEVPNAGLCLLAIWFTRLFGMLGLLEEKEDGKKDLKDTEARIRAIFILQRIVTGEFREYKEQELAFNRILTGCPFYVPLPKTLILTSQEIQTVESMLSGVKSNWDKLKNTSVKGFQHSFIERPGRLEQREDKWVLYVENRSYDILLDSLPWSYRQIRLPWLKKKIHVVWRDKEEFGFDDYNN